MRTITPTPVTGYRPFAAFDSPWNRFERATTAGAAEWPAYNIETAGEDRYRIVLAVPGFRDADLEIVSEPNRLTVEGRPQEPNESVVYRGIATPPFRRTFTLGEHVRVETATLADGLLTIELVREVPEALRPRRIEISPADRGPTGDNRQTH